MTAKERASFRKALEKLQKELTSKGVAKIEPNRASEAEVGGDEDEQPLNEMLQAIASSRNRNLDGVLAQVNAALLKLKESPDEYGTCEECGEDLPTGRLKAMPYAPLCVVCQHRKDGPKGLATRKKLTDFI